MRAARLLVIALSRSPRLPPTSTPPECGGGRLAPSGRVGSCGLPTSANYIRQDRGMVGFRIALWRPMAGLERHPHEHFLCEGHFPVRETLAAPGEENPDGVRGVDHVPADLEEVLDQFHGFDVRHCTQDRTAKLFAGWAGLTTTG